MRTTGTCGVHGLMLTDLQAPTPACACCIVGARGCYACYVHALFTRAAAPPITSSPPLPLTTYDCIFSHFFAHLTASRDLPHALSSSPPPPPLPPTKKQTNHNPKRKENGAGTSPSCHSLRTTREPSSLNQQ